tara:strand:+ start:69 stop:599 length:531 start_codon:yes stop_codon:yes gene_type:complete
MKHKLVNGRWRWTPDESGGLFASYARVSDHATEAGGAISSADTWFTRNLDDEDFDPDNIVTLSNDRFTLGAGTYFLIARAPIIQVGNSACRIYNHTDSSVAIMGEIGFNHQQGAYNISQIETKGRVTITGDKAFELQSIVQNTITHTFAKGFYDTGFVDGGIDYQIHASVDIYKEA